MKVADEGANDAECGATIGGELSHRIEAVLRMEGMGLLARPGAVGQSYTDDSPSLIARHVQAIVDIGSLVNPEEVADTKMNNAWPHRCPIVGWNADLRV